jgi:chromosome segregation ATPase
MRSYFNPQERAAREYKPPKLSQELCDNIAADPVARAAFEQLRQVYAAPIEAEIGAPLKVQKSQASDAQLNITEAMLQVAKNDNKTLSEKVSVQNEMINQQKALIDQLRAERDESVSCYLAEKDRADDLSERNEELEAENAQLKESISKLQSGEEIDSLLSQLIHAQETIDAMLEDLEKKTQEIAEMKEAHSRAQSALGDAMSARDSHCKARDNYAVLSAELEDKLKNLETQYKKTCSELSAKLSASQVRIIELETANRKLADNLVEAHRDNAKIRDEYNTVKNGCGAIIDALTRGGVGK